MVLHKSLLSFSIAASLAAASVCAVAGPAPGKDRAPAPAHGGGGSSSPAPAPGNCSVTDSSVTAADCSGYLSGNTSDASVAAMVAAEQWSGWSGPLVEFTDDNAAFGSVGSTNGLFDVVQADEDDGSLGLLTFLQPISGPFVLALKGGNSWAGYLMDGDFRAGDQIRFDIPGQQGAGLSHASVYATALDDLTPPTSTADVPEPGTLVLAGLGLATIAARWRRRRD